jgi:hypothetical protein
MMSEILYGAGAGSTADKRRTWPFLQEEQADFVALARNWTTEQWAMPSLCEGWSVRDVVVQSAAGRTAGDGLEVRGPGEAILMTISERAAALDELASEFRDHPRSAQGPP